MLRDRWAADVHSVGEFPHGPRPLSQPLKDEPAGGIAERIEDALGLCGFHLTCKPRISQRFPDVRQLADMVRVVERKKCEFIRDRLRTRDLHGGRPSQHVVRERRELRVQARTHVLHHPPDLIAGRVLGAVDERGAAVEQLSPPGVHGIAEEPEDHRSCLYDVAGYPEQVVVAVARSPPQFILSEPAQRPMDERFIEREDHGGWRG